MLRNLLYTLCVSAFLFFADSYSGEPIETVKKYFSFFNPGEPFALEEFRSCFVPGDREKIRTMPSQKQRENHPVGKLQVLDEVKSGNTYELRYRLGNRPGSTGFLVLEKHGDQWLINTALTRSRRQDAITPPSAKVLPSTPEQDRDPLPQPLPQVPETGPQDEGIPPSWQSGPTRGWLLQFSAASEKAKREKRHLLVVCTGSDWCGWCKRLDNEVFRSAEFQEYAAKNLVLLYLNFPRNKPLPAEQLRHNQEIRRKFGFRGGVPSSILLDPEGQVVRRKRGYVPLPAYMEFIQAENAPAPSVSGRGKKKTRSGRMQTK